MSDLGIGVILTEGFKAPRILGLRPAVELNLEGYSVESRSLSQGKGIKSACAHG